MFSSTFSFISSFRKKIIFTGLLIGILCGTAYFSQEDFLASITDSGATNSGGRELFISDKYTAFTGDTGNIQIGSATGFSNISALTFSLNYNPSKVHFSENYTLGAFTSGTGAAAFTPEMVVITPDNVKGVVTVDIASASGFSLAANNAVITLKDAQIQTTIADKEQVSIGFADSQIIDASYNIRSAKTAAGTITIQTQPTSYLKTLDAQAISPTQIQVTFDDYLADAQKVTAKVTTDINSNTAFSAITSAATFSGISIDPADGRRLLLTASAALTAGQTYKLVFGTGPAGNIKTVLDTNNITTYFTVATVASATTTPGTNILSAASALSANTIQLTFSAPVTETNPLKYSLFNSQGIKQYIAQVNVSTGTPVLTTQFAMTSGKYYVIASGVTNMSEKNVQYFFYNAIGASSVQSFQPSSLTPTGGTVVVTGENLDQVSKVSIGNLVIAVSAQSKNGLTLTIPTGLEATLQDVKFELKDGTIIVKEKALSIDGGLGGIQVISSESYASPQRVANDGKMKTTLWALIDYPKGVGDINKVNLDLRPIGGPAIAPMVGVDKSGQMMIVNNRRWFYLDTFVPPTVQTSETPKNITITVEDPRGNKATGVISLIVTKNTIQSQPPEILEAYGVPTQLKPGETVGFYANVKDLDGIKDIDRVVINLGPLGIAPQTLVSSDTITTQAQAVPSSQISGVTTVSNTSTAAQVASATQSAATATSASSDNSIPDQRVSLWYGIQNIKIPANTATGSYSIQVTATDKSGETGTKTINMIITNGNGPFIDEARTQVSPKAQIPKDGKEPFTVTTYVSDADGVDDITSVTLDLKNVGGTIVKMDLQGTVQPGQKGGWFIAKDLTIAKGVVPGGVSLKIYAQDKQGNESDRNVNIEITERDETGTAPLIDSVRSYTTPASASPDATTKMAFNVFVEKHDYQITQVLADLSNIAEYTGQQTASSADAASSCLGATARMVCLTPGIQEGTKGQWYTLSGIVVSKTTPSSMEPYKIKITAVDEKGKTGEGYIALNVNDGTLPTQQIGFPKVQMTISTSPAGVEVLFSNPIDPKKLTLGAFKITETVDTTKTLAITKAVINADATVVTLVTGDQIASTSYTLFADAKSLGLREDQYTDNHAEFSGFDKQAIPPQIVKIKAVSPTQLEVVFSEGLRPSSVSASGRDITIFTDEAQPKRLNVFHTEFSDDNQTLRVSTDSQQSEAKYIFRIQNALSAAGVKVGGNTKPAQTSKAEYFGIHKSFIGFKAVPQATQSIIESVDFDHNGSVDFTDFTIFSSVYGQKLQNPASSSIPAATTQTSSGTGQQTSGAATGTSSSTTSTTFPTSSATSPVNPGTSSTGTSGAATTGTSTGTTSTTTNTTTTNTTR